MNLNRDIKNSTKSISQKDDPRRKTLSQTGHKTQQQARKT